MILEELPLPIIKLVAMHSSSDTRPFAISSCVMSILLLLAALALAALLCLENNESISYEDFGTTEVVRHDMVFKLGCFRFTVAEHIRRRRVPGQLGPRGAPPERGLRDLKRG